MIESLNVNSLLKISDSNNGIFTFIKIFTNRSISKDEIMRLETDTEVEINYEQCFGDTFTYY